MCASEWGMQQRGREGGSKQGAHALFALYMLLQSARPPGHRWRKGLDHHMQAAGRAEAHSTCKYRCTPKCYTPGSMQSGRGVGQTPRTHCNHQYHYPLAVAVTTTRRKMTKADCGKRYYPCGAAARRLGCDEATVQCADGDFCASPADTKLGASRCLPLPPRCGSLNNACCPANKDAVIRERSLLDGTSPVPYCTDGASFCLWRYSDYALNGLQVLNDDGGKQLIWDGYFQRGYGQSRCAPLPPSCGNPGEPCCPSMQDRRISGMVHNRKFRYQPCNYNAAGKVGIYCKVGMRPCCITGTVSRVVTCHGSLIGTPPI